METAVGKGDGGHPNRVDPQEWGSLELTPTSCGKLKAEGLQESHSSHPICRISEC
jgi:hypothetical protein